MKRKQLIELVRAARDLPTPEERRKLRIQADLSLEHLGSALGVSRQAISNWERGARKPRGGHLLAYVALLRELRTLNEERVDA